MCALFGYLDYGHSIPWRVLQKLLQSLANASEVRGSDASGIAYMQGDHLTVYKRPLPAHKLHFRIPNGTSAVMGHTRFTTQGSEKFNENNHPFRGHAGTDFALAHNGVLYNDKELRRVKQLPPTAIETDSYVAVQLLESEGNLDYDSLKNMAESVLGYFAFTLLASENTLWIVKGSSPLYLLHFPEIGLYIYTSTKEIMDKALKRSPLRWMQHEQINVQDGEILRIASDGQITRGTFQSTDYQPFHKWTFPTVYGCTAYQDDDDSFAMLLEVCEYYGVSEDELLHLRELGYTYDELEDYLFDDRLFIEELAFNEI